MQTFDDDIALARQAMATAREKILAEISDYPGPIAGCDVQFIHLLEMRRRLNQALGTLDAPIGTDYRAG